MVLVRSRLLDPTKMKTLDLFAGAGGLTRGLQLAGWETIGAVEYDSQASETYRTNFPDVELRETDISTLDFSPWKGCVQLVAGGPPCQPFSVAGHQRAAGDPRDCVPHFARAVEEIRPDVFLMENVAGLALPRHRHYFQQLLSRLASAGYRVTWDVLDAADYGVPQHRKRVFVVGMRGREFIFPPATHGTAGAKPFVSSRKALADAPEDIPNSAIVSYARKPVLRPQPWDGMLVNGGGRPINPEEPSQTIPASAGGNRTHIVDPDGILIEYHRYLLDGGQPRSGRVPGVRRLTVRESARLQSFPDTHQFIGKQSARYRQVGNAVPPLLARAVALALRQQLETSAVGPSVASADGRHGSAQLFLQLAMAGCAA